MMLVNDMVVAQAKRLGLIQVRSAGAIGVATLAPIGDKPNDVHMRA
jgi:hypothetical protein